MRAEKHGRGLFGPWPVPVVALEDFDARFKAGPLGPSRETEIAFIGAYRVPGGVSDLETWVLGSLAKDAQAIFEFGTATGKTTYLLARNAPGDATVTTLTLGPGAAFPIPRRSERRSGGARSRGRGVALRGLLYQ